MERFLINEISYSRSFTIAKAIEQGWIKAGKPKDFTIKIFEEPQKNFFGLLQKSKIGIFIEERQHRQDNVLKNMFRITAVPTSVEIARQLGVVINNAMIVMIAQD